MKLRQRIFVFIIVLTGLILMTGFPPALLPQFFSSTACAAEVTLAWDANLESNLAGYKLYYENENDIEFYVGTDANEGESPITIYLDELDHPNSPAFTVTGLGKDVYYYFALTAFDTDGMESELSDEVGVMAGKGQAGSGSECFISGADGFRVRETAVMIAGILLFLAAFFPFESSRDR